MPKRNSVFVSVPASSGNMGPGFDVLGLALNLRNDLSVTVLARKPGPPVIEVKGEGTGAVPENSANLVYRSIKAVFQKRKKSVPKLKLVCRNRIPLARGLGSSSAACLSGLLAGNRLLGNPLSQEEILTLATKFEGHPDNAAPALYGGVRASGMAHGNVISAAWPNPNGELVVAVPDFKLSTHKARQVLPTKVPLKDAVFNLSTVALLPAIMTKSPNLLRWALNDRLHEPYRARLVPGFKRVKLAALKAGAWGVTLSGAGPTLLSFVPRGQAKRVASAMQKGFKSAGVKCHTRKLKIDLRGSIVR